LVAFLVAFFAFFAFLAAMLDHLLSSRESMHRCRI
jgi:hypothetical protein